MITIPIVLFIVIILIAGVMTVLYILKLLEYSKYIKVEKVRQIGVYLRREVDSILADPEILEVIDNKKSSALQSLKDIASGMEKAR